MSARRGYQVDVLVNASSKFLCWICALIIREPVQSSCGHRFCKTCLEDVKPGTLCRGCQEDEEETLITPDNSFPDPAIGRELGREAAQCPNKGCPWTGKFKTYTTHERTCDYVKLTCKCGVELSRDDLREHEESKCPLRECPFGCQEPNTETHQREATVRHLQVLLQHVTALRNPPSDGGENPGTAAMIRRLATVEANVAELRERIEVRNQGTTGNHHPGGGDLELPTPPRPQSKSAPVRGTAHPPDVAAAACGLAVDVTPGNYGNASPSNYADASPGNYGNTSSRAVAFGSTQHPSGAEPSVAALREKVDTVEALTALLNREVEKILITQTTLSQQARQNKDTIESLQGKVASLERSLALKDVALAEKELRLQSLESTSFDGVCVWAITDFSRKRQDAITGRTPSIYSTVFFTGRAGYKCCARIYLNGDGMGKGTHISLFFVIMRGQYDAVLPWPFKQKVSMMLLDQNNRKEHVVDAFRPDPTSSSFRRPQSDMNIASGVPLFCPLSKLEDRMTQYVKDDTIFIKIIVDSDHI